MKRLVAYVAILALVASAACGGGKKKEAAKPKPTTTVAPASTVPPPAGNGGAPLTGLPPDPASASRAALVAKIDNAPKGRPQAGINQADVVYEEGVEGGITRLAVVFQSQLPGTIGPVRSARTTDILISAALNHPLFAWSGSNATFVKAIRSAPLIDVGVDVKGGAYRRDPKRPNPYTRFADPNKLYEGVTAAPPPPLFTYRAAGEASAGDPAAKAHMEWKDKVQTLVDWEWAADVGAWKRTENGTAHVDADGAQVLAKNVVIQFATYHDTGQRDQSNTMVPEADLIGEGEAWLLSDGKVVKGHWKKGAEGETTSYTDAAGAPFKLTPGSTWVELPKPGMASVA